MPSWSDYLNDEEIDERDEEDRYNDDEFANNNVNKRETLSKSESAVDANGVKTVVTFEKNAEGKKVKVTKTVKVTKEVVMVPKDVLRRRETWRKFGACQDVPNGVLEEGVTSLGDEVFVVPKKKTVQVTTSQQKKDEVFAVSVVCRKCGKVGEHWTSKCPFKDRADLPAAQQTASASQASSTSGEAGRYVPPTMRGMKAGERAPAGMGMGMRDESNTVRVSNLSDETREDDLRELVRPFGPVSRVYLVKHKNTGQSRGFAYITFQRRDDGQRAIDRLNGHGYDHLILKFEWAERDTKP